MTISRDHTALFGSDPKCDVVVDDPQALPFHGRLRWKGGKFKAEAFPEANALVLNGKKVVAASFGDGDEIRVGQYRIFLANADDGPADPDKTREQAQSKAAKAAAGRPSAASAKGTSAATLGGPTGKPTAPVLPPRPPGPIKKFINVLLAKDQRPGEEKIASSPLVLALAVALVALIAIGISLFTVIRRTTADRMYMTANESFTNKSWVTALRDYDLFLDSFPHEARASKARVRRALCNVEQHVSGTPNWTAALTAEKEMLKKVGNEGEAYETDAANLAELVLKTAVGLAERAKVSADRYALDDAKTMMSEMEAAVVLHDKVAGNNALALRGRSLLPQKLTEARASVQKAEVRTKALADMDAAIKAGSADAIYATRDALVGRFRDFATDKDVVSRLTQANELIQKNVKFDPSGRPAETSPHPDPLGPPTSLVFRKDPTAAPTPNGPVVYAMAQGLAYALDGTNGAPLWHLPVGLSAPFPPVSVPGSPPTCLVYDTRHGELVRYDGRTGKMLWRQATNEPINSPPLVLGNQVAQLTPSGKLLLIELSTGALKGSVNLGRGAARTPATDESGEHLYIAADRDVVFVISRETMACTSVQYLGHSPGSIPCAGSGRSLPDRPPE